MKNLNIQLKNGVMQEQEQKQKYRGEKNTRTLPLTFKKPEDL